MKKIIIYIGILFLAACKNNTKTETTTAQEKMEASDVVTLSAAQLKNAGIAVQPLAKASISGTIKLNGITELPPQNLVSVSAPLGGYLKSTKLIPGMQVRKGEVIAVLEDAQFVTLQQEYLTAKAKIVFAEKEYLRQRELNAQSAASDKAAEAASAELATLRITAKALSEKLKLIAVNPDNLTENTLSKSVSVYAPISGSVSKVNVNTGKFVQPSEVMFDLIDQSDVHFVLTVFEKDVASIRVGQRLKVTDESANRQYTAEILLIGKEVDSDRTVKAHCHFVPNASGVMPGKYLIAELPVDNRETYTVPADAVVSSEGKNYVFVEEADTRFKIAEVTAGATENGMTAIDFVDVKPDSTTKVVAKGAYSLLMKMKNSEGGE